MSLALWMYFWDLAAWGPPPPAIPRSIQLAGVTDRASSLVEAFDVAPDLVGVGAGTGAFVGTAGRRVGFSGAGSRATALTDVKAVP